MLFEKRRKQKYFKNYYLLHFADKNSAVRSAFRKNCIKQLNNKGGEPSFFHISDFEARNFLTICFSYPVLSAQQSVVLFRSITCETISTNSGIMRCNTIQNNGGVVQNFFDFSLFIASTWRAQVLQNTRLLCAFSFSGVTKKKYIHPRNRLFSSISGKFC